MTWPADVQRDPPPATRPATQVERVRSTQSLVSILAECWRQPGLIARELAWRWLFGLPALALLSSCAQRLLAILFAANTGIEDFSLQRPVAAAQLVRAAYLAVAPAALHLAAWVAPLLLLGWAAASGIGRAFVLRKLIPSGRPRAVSLCLLQLLRVSALALTVAAWFVMVRAAAARTIVDQPPGVEPAMVAFAAWLICLSIGSFIVWALWSWLLSIASVLMVAEDRSLPSALAAGLRQGRLTMQLVEINLVLGIVKLALIVLAMVFSAIPLPFEAQMSGPVLHLWYVVVAIWYLAASDFFQVGRLAAFAEFWKRGKSGR